MLMTRRTHHPNKHDGLQRPQAPIVSMVQKHDGIEKGPTHAHQQGAGIQGCVHGRAAPFTQQAHFFFSALGLAGHMLTQGIA
jgi:hypothetical protein